MHSALVSAIWADLTKIRQQNPLVLNLTNFVTMDFIANALLALGASPLMSHAEEESADMVKLANSIVVNIGTLDPTWIRAMTLTLRQAEAQQKLVVLDPVGAGASTLRTDTSRGFINSGAVKIVRGNASEIMACADFAVQTKGVDTQVQSHAAQDVATLLARRKGLTVVTSGATDFVVDGKQVARIDNGSELMTKVTGMGCVATAVVAAFAAVNPAPIAAATHAMAVMGVCGDVAATKTQAPGSFRVAFIDALYNLREDDLRQRLRATLV